MNRPAIAGAVTICLVPLGSRADIVRLSDGRVIEGNLLHRDDAEVTIDAKVASIRATLRFPADQIDSVEEKELPAGFFDPPPAAERISDEASFDQNDSLYIEVPVAGVFGETFVADGLASTLAYAKRHRIPNIVFTIDSTGGDPDEAAKAYDMLRRAGRDLSFHAVIRNCTGDAIAVALWCDTFAVIPGATVGGVTGEDIRRAGKESANQLGVYRAEIAHRVARDLEQRGRPNDIVRAMIDPAVRLAAWRDPGGWIERAAFAPTDIAPDQIVFQCDASKSLTLTHDQAVALGVPSFNGDLSKLGELLELEEFKPESDFGIRAMEQASLKRRQREANVSAKYEADVEENIRTRETTNHFIHRQVQNAAKWDPTRGTYERYGSVLDLGWGGGAYTGYSSSWNQESRHEWTRRTDTTIGYLREAQKGVRSMAALDRNAIKLCLDPTFAEGELEWMAKDLKVKIADLQANRMNRGT